MITVAKVEDGSGIAFSAVSKESDGREVLGRVRIVRSWFEAEIEECCVGRAFDAVNAKDLLVSQLQYRAAGNTTGYDPADVISAEAPADALVEAPLMAPSDPDGTAYGASVFSQDKTAVWPPAAAMLRAQSRTVRERPVSRSRPVRPERRARIGELAAG